jgi:hypothetical protein
MLHRARRRLAALAVGTSAAAVALIPTAAHAAPANDMFADAQVIAGWSGALTATNVGATWEANEPQHKYLASGQHSVSGTPGRRRRTLG